MSAHHQATLDSNENTRSASASTGWMGLGIGAVILLIVWAITGRGEEARRFYFAYLSNFAFFLSLSLGGLFFVLVSHLMRNGTGVVTRRIGEIVAGNFIVMAVLFVPVIVGLVSYDLFTWVNPEQYYHGHHLTAVQGKSAWLNTNFFVLRFAIYFAIWIGLGWFYLKTSRKQDETGDPNLTKRMERISVIGMPLFGVTITLAAFDMLMSLDAAFFSTMYGVYYFSGSIVGFYSLLCLLLWSNQKRGYLVKSVNDNHYHDVGKMMFAFTVFWAYIAYSQYMLICYASIPEETGSLIFRGYSSAPEHKSAWTLVPLILLFGHFVIPFLGFMSRSIKRKKVMLCVWAVWLLILHWIDVWAMIMPYIDLGTDKFPVSPAESLSQYFGLAEVGCLVGMGAVFIGGLLLIASGKHLLPIKDPRLSESLIFENV